MRSVGYDALSTRISCAMMRMCDAARNFSTSNVPSFRRNFMRLSEARLHAVSLRNMYSLHGLLATIGSVSRHVCHRFTVSCIWSPGSPQNHAASAISRMTSRARNFSLASPLVTNRVYQSLSFSTACMNSSVTRTELFAFWKYTESYAPPGTLNPGSYPASMSACAFRSSSALHRMKSMTSGWSTFNTTIFAARRVLPPDLIVPAEVSAAFMKDTGPDGVPPPESFSFDERSTLRFTPLPDPYLKIIPSLRYHSRMLSIRSSTERIKHAEHCGCSSMPTLNHTGLLNAASCRRTR